MKCHREGASRTLQISDIKPSTCVVDGFFSPLTELEIEIRHTGPGSTFNGVCIDHVIIPLIVAALNDNEK